MRAYKTDTPSRFFLAYAAGCLDARLQANTLDKEVYNALRRHIVQDLEPTTTLLQRAFPRAASGVGEFTFERVWRYWRTEHRSPNEPTPVIGGVVRGISTVGQVQFVRIGVIDGHADTGEIIRVNMLHFPLACGYLVLTHGTIVAEVFLPET